MKLQTVQGKATAIVATAVMGLGLALAAPLSATAATTSYTLDCDDLPDDYREFFVLPGDTVTFNLTGFDTVYDWGTNADIDTLDPAGDTYVVTAGQYLEFYNNESPCPDYFDVLVSEAVAETPPPGSLLFTQNIAIPANTTNEILLTDNDPDPTNSEHLLNGIEDCRLSTEIHGRHVYGTLDITVLTSGTYTFRGLIETPLGYYNSLNAYDPMADPFLAVYSNFDPAAPSNNVVGCNDDLNDIGDENDAEFKADGTIIDGHQPRFEAVLAPGQYTLVLFTWEDLSAENFADGYGPWEDDNFVVGAKSVSFELWGPLGGLALGRVSPQALAATGVATTYAGLGAFVLLAGLGLVLVSRRRRPETP